MFSKDYLSFVLELNHDLKGNIITKPKDKIPSSYYYNDSLKISRWAIRYLKDIEDGLVYFRYLIASKDTIAYEILHTDFLEEYKGIETEIKLLLLEFAAMNDILVIEEVEEKYYKLINKKDLTNIIHTTKYVLDSLGTGTDYPQIYDFFQEMYITFGYIRKDLVKITNEIEEGY